MQPLISERRSGEQREVGARSSATTWVLRFLAVAGVHGLAVLALWLLSDWRPFNSQEPLMIELMSSSAEASHEVFTDSPEAAAEPSFTPPVISSQAPPTAQAEAAAQLPATVALKPFEVEQEQAIPSLSLSLSPTLPDHPLGEPAAVKDKTETVNPNRPIPEARAAPTPPPAKPSPAPLQPTALAAAPMVAPDVGPRATSSPKPPYPLTAFKAKQEGRVVLELEVLEDGTVGQVRLAKSSDFDSLDASALATVKKWKYSPAQKNGQIVKQWIRVSILFEVKAR
jgi:protein TonB